jgi:phage/plasmid primase-like uncharacterized protein
MGFERDRLPDPMSYFEAEGLRLKGPNSSKWKTTECRFHGGSDSMRVNAHTGAWVCMACGVKGGDILSYQMQAHGIEFIEAAKTLGAWVEDGKPYQAPKNSPSLPPRAALSVLHFEAMLIAIEGSRIGNGIPPTADDLSRIRTAANHILTIAREYE